ncbi:alpha/beta hydrolase [Nocardia stercoris]|uniref:Alpha/beta hydrolase n=1 Tax=Nocardia stercoris TaxID=2483361 RepID=A0A3M2L1B5_9NOCA|nr:alpha/beta hydrolase [Nocardia stercoris]
MSCERRGSGSPIVLVHGLGSRWQCFEPILDRLAAEHEVIAVDLPGFGRTPPIAGVEPGARGYARWLTGWLDRIGIERPHVVGSSMGGGVALELGRAGIACAVTAFAPIGCYGRPGLWWVQGLLTALRAAGGATGPLVSAALDHPAGKAVLLSALFGRPGRVPADSARADVAALVAAASFVAARDSFGGYRLALGDDPGALRRIPVTVAWGTRDAVLTYPTQSRRARAVLPFARHVALRHCGHLPFNDDPAACAALVLQDQVRRRDLR